MLTNQKVFLFSKHLLFLRYRLIFLAVIFAALAGILVLVAIWYWQPLERSYQLPAGAPWPEPLLVKQFKTGVPVEQNCLLGGRPVQDARILSMIARLKKWSGVNSNFLLSEYDGFSAHIHRLQLTPVDQVKICLPGIYLKQLRPNTLQVILAHEVGHLYCGHIDGLGPQKTDRRQTEADAFCIKMVGLAEYRQALKETFQATMGEFASLESILNDAFFAEFESRSANALQLDHLPRRVRKKTG